MKKASIGQIMVVAALGSALAACASHESQVNDNYMYVPSRPPAPEPVAPPTVIAPPPAPTVAAPVQPPPAAPALPAPAKPVAPAAKTPAAAKSGT